jgi:hypothetical protein
MGVDGQRHDPAVLRPEITQYPLCRRLGGPQGRSGWVRKISHPPAFDTLTMQPVAVAMPTALSRSVVIAPYSGQLLIGSGCNAHKGGLWATVALFCSGQDWLERWLTWFPPFDCGHHARRRHLFFWSQPARHFADCCGYMQTSWVTESKRSEI